MAVKTSLPLFLFAITLLLYACRPQGDSTPPIVVDNDTLPLPPPPPPRFPVDYDTTEWMELGYLDSSIVIDMRYASENNFVKAKMYDCGRCFLRPKAARYLVQAHHDLKERGYGGIKVFDCYRPRPFQQRLWDKVPDARFVTPPEKGSMHNRGAAVDLTILDAEGNELDMGTDFDYFGREAYHAYPEHNDTIQANRELLKGVMYKHGYKHIRTEWWHYSFQMKNYVLSDWLWNCDL